MMIQEFSDSDLHAELERRRRERAAEHKCQLEAHYGMCPECGAGIALISSEVVDEFWTAPDWNGWPLPPPPHYRKRVGATWGVKIVCPNGHERYLEETRFTKTA